MAAGFHSFFKNDDIISQEKPRRTFVKTALSLGVLIACVSILSFWVPLHRILVQAGVFPHTAWLHPAARRSYGSFLDHH